MSTRNEKRRRSLAQETRNDGACTAESRSVDRGDDIFDDTSPVRHLSELGSAALRYAGNGWSVFPLVPGAKNPLTLHGFLDATTDADVIGDWWASTPEANVGIAVPDGMVVIDADIYKPGGVEDLARLERELGQLPAGPTVRTGRGGLQFWMRVPAGKRFRGTAAKTIDVRAGGKHYVVAPPSVVDGGHYAWVA